VSMRIAIQGIKGCFHQIAANNYFGSSVDVKECLTFHDLVSSVKNKDSCNLGIMAIENSIAGSLLQNYRLLQKNNLNIIGETYLRIQQNLIAPKGIKLAEIKEIHSHPMAIYQCETYLNSISNVKVVETEDTALSVKNLQNISNLKRAAIGSSLSAEIYKMNILEKSIETNKKNYTRFLIISNDASSNLEESNKASIYLELDNKKGSLANVLQIISANNINLSKLQSYPIIGSNWQYYFHLDLEYEEFSDFNNSIKQINPYISGIKILGNYIKGIK